MKQIQIHNQPQVSDSQSKTKSQSMDKNNLNSDIDRVNNLRKRLRKKFQKQGQQQVTQSGKSSSGSISSSTSNGSTGSDSNSSGTTVTGSASETKLNRKEGQDDSYKYNDSDYDQIDNNDQMQDQPKCKSDNALFGHISKHSKRRKVNRSKAENLRAPVIESNQDSDQLSGSESVSSYSSDNNVNKQQSSTTFIPNLQKVFNQKHLDNHRDQQLTNKQLSNRRIETLWLNNNNKKSMNHNINVKQFTAFGGGNNADAYENLSEAKVNDIQGNGEKKSGWRPLHFAGRWLGRKKPNKDTETEINLQADAPDMDGRKPQDVLEAQENQNTAKDLDDYESDQPGSEDMEIPDEGEYNGQTKALQPYTTKPVRPGLVPVKAKKAIRFDEDVEVRDDVEELYGADGESGGPIITKAKLEDAIMQAKVERICESPQGVQYPCSDDEADDLDRLNIEGSNRFGLDNSLRDQEAVADEIDSSHFSSEDWYKDDPVAKKQSYLKRFGNWVLGLPSKAYHYANSKRKAAGAYGVKKINQAKKKVGEMKDRKMEQFANWRKQKAQKMRAFKDRMQNRAANGGRMMQRGVYAMGVPFVTAKKLIFNSDYREHQAKWAKGCINDAQKKAVLKRNNLATKFAQKVHSATAGNTYQEVYPVRKNVMAVMSVEQNPTTRSAYMDQGVGPDTMEHAPNAAAEYNMKGQQYEPMTGKKRMQATSQTSEMAYIPAIREGKWGMDSDNVYADGPTGIRGAKLIMQEEGRYRDFDGFL